MEGEIYPSLVTSSETDISPRFPTTRSVSTPFANLVLIIFLRFLISIPPIIFKRFIPFPITRNTALTSASIIITGSSYFADKATKAQSQRTKISSYQMTTRCKYTDFLLFHKGFVQKKQQQLQPYLKSQLRNAVASHTIVNFE